MSRQHTVQAGVLRWHDSQSGSEPAHEHADIAGGTAPLVHRGVDALDDIGLETVHRVILRMRMAESLERLDGMADEMREKGVLERLPQIIAEVRARRRAQA